LTARQQGTHEEQEPTSATLAGRDVHLGYQEMDPASQDLNAKPTPSWVDRIHTLAEFLSTAGMSRAFRKKSSR
jgi:hypothetical protein